MLWIFIEVEHHLFLLRLVFDAVYTLLEMFPVMRCLQLTSLNRFYRTVTIFIFSKWSIHLKTISLFWFCSYSHYLTLTLQWLVMLSIVTKWCLLWFSVVEIRTQSNISSLNNSHISLAKTLISRNESRDGMHFGVMLLCFFINFSVTFRLLKADGHIEYP